jgi:ElaA protein
MWRCTGFTELSSAELYSALALRAEVFVTEQRCAFTDPDGQDAQAWHVLGHSKEGQLLAYARFFEPSPDIARPAALSCARSPGMASIGRVVTAPQVRRCGLGGPLMRYTLEQLYARCGAVAVQIGAQSRLLDFYASFGFIATGGPFLEDGILHQYMQLPPPESAQGMTDPLRAP